MACPASQAATDSVRSSPGFADVLRAEEQTWRSHWADKSLLVKGNLSIPRFRANDDRESVYYPAYAEREEFGELFSDDAEWELHQTEVRAQHESWLASLLLRLHEDVLLLRTTLASRMPRRAMFFSRIGVSWNRAPRAWIVS